MEWQVESAAASPLRQHELAVRRGAGTQAVPAHDVMCAVTLEQCATGTELMRVARAASSTSKSRI